MKLEGLIESQRVHINVLQNIIPASGGHVETGDKDLDYVLLAPNDSAEDLEKLNTKLENTVYQKKLIC